MNKAARLPVSCDLARDLIVPQLMSKKQYCRTQKPLAQECNTAKRAFLDEFRRCMAIALEDQPEAKQVIHLEEFTGACFDRFWTIETFEDCEELPD